MIILKFRKLCKLSKNSVTLINTLYIFKYIIRGLFSGVFLRGPHPEHWRKYLRVYSESSLHDDSVFCSMVRSSICSHSEFLPRALNSEFPTLEDYICFSTQHFWSHIWNHGWKKIQDISLNIIIIIIIIIYFKFTPRRWWLYSLRKIK